MLSRNQSIGREAVVRPAKTIAGFRGNMLGDMLLGMSRKSHWPPDRSTLLPPLPDLGSALARLVAQIPAGRVATCGALAEALGFRGAAVWVAQWAADHRHHAQCHCHRIVRASGELGSYIAGSEVAKGRLLQSEGVPLGRQPDRAAAHAIVEQCAFSAFQCDRPLAALIELQHRVAALRCSKPPRRPPSLVAGFDSAYRGDGMMQAACAVCDAEGNLIHRVVIRRPAPFPYISTLLAYRELPAYEELLDRLRAERCEPELLMIDGSGVLHPRAAGIAVHFGAMADLPAIGVSKTLLFGRCDTAGMQPGESRPTVVEDETRGVAYRPSESSRKCVFVSPGHRCDVGFAERWVRRLTIARRLPEPLYWADRLSRQSNVD